MLWAQHGGLQGQAGQGWAVWRCVAILGLGLWPQGSWCGVLGSWGTDNKLNGTIILANTSDNNSDSQRADLVVEAITRLLPPWWPVGHGKEVPLHAFQSLVQWCWWGVGCLTKSDSFCVPFWLAVHSQTFTVTHQALCPGLCCMNPSVVAGAWSLEWKAALRALCFPLKILGMVACRLMGIWGLSLTPFIRASW